MKMSGIRWLMSGILALSLASCGDGEQADNTQSLQASAAENSIDPCALLSSADIEAALGWKVDKAEGKAYGATGTCNYSSATPYTAQGLQQLSVVIGQGMPDMSSAEAMAKWRLEQYSGDAYKDMNPLVKPVEGLGVPAIQNGMADMFAIEMAVGDKLVALSLFDSLEPARTLAEKVLARLK